MIVFSFLIVVLIVVSGILPQDNIILYVGLAVVFGIVDFFIFRRLFGGKNKEAKIKNNKKNKSRNMKNERREQVTQGQNNRGNTVALNMNKQEIHNYKARNEIMPMEEPEEAFGTVSLLDGTDESSRVSHGAQKSSIKPVLVTFESGVEKKVYITKTPFKIGRAKGSVDFICDKNGISRIHAEIVYENGDYYIKDLESKNGTFVNNQNLQSNRKYFIENGDCIMFANKEYTFKIPDGNYIPDKMNMEENEYLAGTGVLFEE